MTTEDLTIRPFDAADTETLSAIWLDASLIAHPFIGRARLLDQRRLIETEYLPKAETSVAWLGLRPVGFISLIGDFIGGLFVAPDAQGRGIGRRLIAHAMQDRAELSLEVYTDNAQALAFYRAQGFAEVSRRAVDDQGDAFPNALLRLQR